MRGHSRHQNSKSNASTLRRQPHAAEQVRVSRIRAKGVKLMHYLNRGYAAVLPDSVAVLVALF